MGIERDYTIRFKTTHEGQGAQKLEADLKGLNEEAKKTPPILDENAKKHTLLDLSTSKLAKTIKELKHEIPGLGIAVKLLTNPYAAVTAAIAAFIVQMRRQIAAQDDLAAKAGEFNAQMTPLVGTASTVRDRMREAATATSNLA